MDGFDTASLLGSLGRLHTTPMGAERIRRNLALGADEDVVAFCRARILDGGCVIRRQGKNWYCDSGGARITVNARSLTIVTAHVVKQGTDSAPGREKG